MYILARGRPSVKIGLLHLSLEYLQVISHEL